MKTLVSSLIVLSLVAAAQVASAQSNPNNPAAAPSTSVQADNSRSNKLDRSNTTATADAQKDNETDRSLTQRIRQSIMADKSLSTYAHNVKIVSINGSVTLNGVVRSDQERSAIESKAKSLAGASHVTNELKVTPD